MDFQSYPSVLLKSFYFNFSPSSLCLKFPSKVFPSQTYNYFLRSDFVPSHSSPNNHLFRTKLTSFAFNKNGFPFFVSSYIPPTFLHIELFCTLRNLSLQWRLSSNQLWTVAPNFRQQICDSGKHKARLPTDLNILSFFFFFCNK